MADASLINPTWGLAMMMIIIIMAKMMIMIVMMIRMMIKKPTVADVSLTNPPSRLRLPLWQSPFLGRHCQMEVSGHLRSHESVTFSSFEGKSVSVAGEGSHLRGSTLSLLARGR